MAENVEELMKELAFKIAKLAHNAKEGHIPSSLSVLDIIYVIYKDLILFNGQLNDSYRFILSKGHASLGLYVVLNHFQLMSDQELDSFGGRDSLLGGHPDMRKLRNVEASTGSLGHGLPLGVGLALGGRTALEQVLVLLGDGELNEGSNWESLLLIEEMHLTNVKIIVDVNHSNDRSIRLPRLARKFESFGFEVHELNGHDHSELSLALRRHSVKAPQVILANTIKGFRIAQMESNHSWHHRIPSLEELVEIEIQLGLK